MTESAVLHPAPHRGLVRPGALAFAVCAAPAFWIAQELLGYGVSSVACYSDHPTVVRSATALRGWLIAFDVVAIIAALAGGLVSWACWRAAREEKEGDHRRAIDLGDGRTRFLSLWGLIASVWFFFAIVFETISSVMGPLCVP
jgi:hypothetical protein